VFTKHLSCRHTQNNKYYIVEKIVSKKREIKIEACTFTEDGTYLQSVTE